MKKIAALTIVSLLLLSSCFKKPGTSDSQAGNNIEPTKPAVTLQPTPANSDVGSQNLPSITKAPEEEAPPVTEVSANNIKYGWGLKLNSNHQTPGIPASVESLLKRYSAYYVGDTSSKVIYLTFDEGYENGYTGKILDILKANEVPAAFFVTRPYIKQNPELIKRMVNEGHIVGNHSSHHPSMPSKTDDVESFNREFSEVEAIFKEITGKDMPKFFRPPMGEYSEKSLELTQNLGYKTIFWSFAHKDWIVDDQPTVQAAHDKIMKGSHNGEIMLLHAVSKSNTEALDSVLKDLKAEGYRFASLEELK